MIASNVESAANHRNAGLTRIVAAEDDPSTRRFIEHVIRNAGYDIEMVANGEAALEAIRRLPPALVLLDVLMPRLDGWEVARMLKSDPETAAIPIIFLTANAQEHDVLEGFVSGAADYLTKPFSPRELQARIRTVLART